MHTCILQWFVMPLDENLNIPCDILSKEMYYYQPSFRAYTLKDFRKGMENSEEWYGKLADSENSVYSRKSMEI